MSQSAKPIRPLIIAGPCCAESLDLLHQTAKFLKNLAKKLEFDLIFKASFDKANRTSIHSYRGPGIEQGLRWFAEIRETHDVSFLTDVHETKQVEKVAVVCDYLQIPAFLCRQTDLLMECVKYGSNINIKKGQFLAPENCQHLVNKALLASEQQQKSCNILLTERGASFGYGNLVVDMRSLPILAENHSLVIFDITHSLQKPSASGPAGAVSGGDRRFAPVLARAAAATGYLHGFFLEVHPEPSAAKSDASTQLDYAQCETLLTQLIPIWNSARQHTVIDGLFS